jgi:hypothetical protein
LRKTTKGKETKEWKEETEVKAMYTMRERK